MNWLCGTSVRFRTTPGLYQIKFVFTVVKNSKPENHDSASEGGWGNYLYIYDIVGMCRPNSPLFQPRQYMIGFNFQVKVYECPNFLTQQYMNSPRFPVWYINGPSFLASLYGISAKISFLETQSRDIRPQYTPSESSSESLRR